MILSKIGLVGLVLLPTLVCGASAEVKRPVKPIQQLLDRHAATEHFRALGYRARGGIERDTTERDAANGHSFPHFSSSFSVGGTRYPFTMVGYRPQSGRSASLKSVIIPLRMNFAFFGANRDVSHSFDPSPAVTNIVHSPMYKPAAFPNGVGQFVDQMQRAAFWNLMDEDHQWHVRMEAPRVLEPIDIEVTPETATGLAQDANGNFFGDVFIDFLDSQAHSILQLLQLDADTLPIFVTDNVTAEALGYHTAYTIQNDENGTRLQTFIAKSYTADSV